MRRRTALVVSGAILLALAGVAATAGIALAVVFKGGDALASGPQPVTTSTRAVVSAVAQLDGGTPSGLGQARMQVDVTARDGQRGVFVGVAAADDVQRYLTGADVDLVTDVQFQPFRLTTRHQPGTVVVPAPGAQDFWLARAQADAGTARLTWPSRDGDYRLVIMNADGSPDVDVDARFALVLPSASRITMIVIATAVGTGLLGVVMLTFALVASRSDGAGRTPAGTPPLVPTPQGANTAATRRTEAQ